MFNFESLISNEGKSESGTSIATTDMSSNDSSNKCDFTFYRWQLSKRQSINEKIDDLVNDTIHIFKEDLKTLKTYLY